MSNPLANIVEKYAVVPRLRLGLVRLQRSVVGLAQDFWTDGNWEKRDQENGLQQGASIIAAQKVSEQHHKTAQAVAQETGLWHALPGEISEKMWGQGCVTPGDEYITERLVMPLGINKNMSLLDLSAGLGGRVRKTAQDYGVYITGLEPDPEIAARGMAISVAAGKGKHAGIAAYDPVQLKVTRKYDGIIARETLYRVADKRQFIQSIVACCKDRVQVSFTDYIVNSEAHDQPAIAAWRAFEQGADPVGLVEMAEMWAKAGINLRVHDDLTDYYKKEVKEGLLRFAKFMASGVKPDAETKKAMAKRITTWAHRMAALEQGMKFYRFYGLR